MLNEIYGFQITKKQANLFLAIIFIFSMFTRFFIAIAHEHFYDLSFYVDWSSGIMGDLFGAYENIPSLDYPPMFLFLLYITGILLQQPFFKLDIPFEMLPLKLWQVIFDLLLILLVYLWAKRFGNLIALIAASIWSITPTMIVNSSFWGQTDSIMLFLIFLSYYLLEEKHFIFACVIFSIACLTKFQSLYFAPIFILYLLTHTNIKTTLKGIISAILTVLAVFGPFMARSGSDLPFRVYFHGYKSYPFASLNAFNLYSMLGLNLKEDNTVLFLGLSAKILGTVFLILSVVFLIFLYFKAPQKDLYLFSFLFMQCIFIFTCRMHERYQIPSLLFLFLAAIKQKDFKLFSFFLPLTIVTFLNHFIVLQGNLIDPSIDIFNMLKVFIIIMSAFNIILFLYSGVYTVKLLLNGEKLFIGKRKKPH